MSAITFPREVPAQGLNVLWTRASFAGLMLVTFVLYMSGLDRNGWANAYYAAAVEAGATNWKAFFFGSLDTSNFITVDKSPAFLWVMEISARRFGFNEWSVLVPQALEGVATVGIVFVAVRRWFGPAARWHSHPAGSSSWWSCGQAPTVLTSEARKTTAC